MKERSVGPWAAIMAILLSFLGAIATFATQQPSGSVVIFTGNSWANLVNIEVADFWRNEGFTVEVVGVVDNSTDPDAVRDFIDNEIALRAANGAFYFHLIGDANDYRQFGNLYYTEMWDTPAWVAQRNSIIGDGADPQGSFILDRIPTFYVKVPGEPYTNLPAVVPYYHTDMPYADIDGDRVPDVVVTRWPARTISEVCGMVDKMEHYHSTFQTNPEWQSFVHYFQDDSTVDEYHRIRYSNWIEGVESFIDPLFDMVLSVDPLNNEECSFYYNMNAPNILLISGLTSNRTRPGNSFSRFGDPVEDFSMSSIGRTGNHYPIVLAPTCRAANFAHVEDSLGRPTGEEFVVAGDRGAIAWIGPTEGTWQNVDEDLGERILRAIVESPDQPIAESWMEAIRAYMVEYAGCNQEIMMAESFAFLGSPCTYYCMLDIVTSEEDLPVASFSMSAYPNPFNPKTTIVLAGEHCEDADVRIYSLDGKLVRRLSSGVKGAAATEYEWDGACGDGSSAPSGVYIARAAAGGFTAKKKIVLAK